MANDNFKKEYDLYLERSMSIIKTWQTITLLKSQDIKPLKSQIHTDLTALKFYLDYLYSLEVECQLVITSLKNLTPPKNPNPYSGFLEDKYCFDNAQIIEYILNAIQYEIEYTYDNINDIKPTKKCSDLIGLYKQLSEKYIKEQEELLDKIKEKGN